MSVVPAASEWQMLRWWKLLRNHCWCWVGYADRCRHDADLRQRLGNGSAEIAVAIVTRSADDALVG